MLLSLSGATVAALNRIAVRENGSCCCPRSIAIGHSNTSVMQGQRLRPIAVMDGGNRPPDGELAAGAGIRSASAGTLDAISIHGMLQHQ